ncbi:DUF2971 domain-containing protein [Vibrio metschnikovii]|uniref:DUF2971 domain-containing protein n=1 Tax=Vibrio metschnikovii TaxID=28172 RepID=UPI0029F7FCD6|nr:DUF2971 domain-containing protein [Vibrio metschnikovii]EKO3646683.1 DUF2971 domain-containing protein [Vibrio metschnikovii]EKO3650133.1 DUF2971 domain-containing protein [Vibrio metschnikovii]ELZ5774692.1 DUF2971 domain-containing protein [Vibrio metschnikovii]
MKKIYKYMPFREEFFNNYCLRASQRGVLNDPFELSPAQDLVDKVLREGLGEDFFEQAEQFATDGNFNEVGVISFTENYNNLLMWSHYAHEHKGIVVEFDYKKLDYFFNYRLSMRDTIERVLYNRERFSPLQTEVCVKDLLLTKSDDWIYEKEHRILPKLRLADYVRVDRELFEQLHEFYDNLYVNLFNIVAEDKHSVTFEVDLVEYEHFNNQDWDGNSTDDREEMKYSHSDVILNEIYGSLALLPTSVFLFQLPSDCITAVFVGCRTPNEDVKQIQALIGSKNIPIFKAQLSKTHFTLGFEEMFV